MEHAVAEHAVAENESKAHMGLPLPNGKLAMWLFLVTEIMFFTAQIGVHLSTATGAPTRPAWLLHEPTWSSRSRINTSSSSSVASPLSSPTTRQSNVQRSSASPSPGLGVVFLVRPEYQ
jgi:heme/copper-type cytochrome/quinol oxidase subunit 3